MTTIKELFNNETFTFYEWIKIYIYNDWLNYAFKGINDTEKKNIICKHAIKNKVKLYRP